MSQKRSPLIYGACAYAAHQCTLAHIYCIQSVLTFRVKWKMMSSAKYICPIQFKTRFVGCNCINSFNITGLIRSEVYHTGTWTEAHDPKRLPV